MSLSELITKDSCCFLISRKLTRFLLENPASWQSLNSYQSGLINIGAVKVVNDCAEREVKLRANISPYARSEDHYQNLLQEVEM